MDPSLWIIAYVEFARFSDFHRPYQLKQKTSNTAHTS